MNSPTQPTEQTTYLSAKQWWRSLTKVDRFLVREWANYRKCPDRIEWAVDKACCEHGFKRASLGFLID